MPHKDAAPVESFSRVAPGTPQEGAKRWRSPLDRARAFGATEDRFYKIADRRAIRTARQQDLRGEFDLLRRCQGLAGVPEALELIEEDGGQTLVLRRIPGEPLSRLGLGWPRFVLVMLRLIALVWSIARRGVRHNDLRPENVMVAPDGRVHLVDFDQASRGGLVEGVLAGLGLRVGGAPVHNGLLAPLRERLQAGLSPRLIRILRRAPGRVGRRAPPLAALPADAGPRLRALHAAWRIAAAADASSPGRHVAYHELVCEGVCLPGERPWAERWRSLRLATSFADRRVLELGCNLALLSTFLLKEAGASAALAVDRDRSILSAAAIVAAGFDVRPAFAEVDFDLDPHWEERLAAFQPDVVVALSVLHWVRDQARFLAFLGRFDEVVLEGHDSSRLERERLRRAGFAAIDLIDTSERGRPILLARKR
jgi:SAM-dependent methyltransferase